MVAFNRRETRRRKSNDYPCQRLQFNKAARLTYLFLKLTGQRSQQRDTTAKWPYITRLLHLPRCSDSIGLPQCEGTGKTGPRKSRRDDSPYNIYCYQLKFCGNGMQSECTSSWKGVVEGRMLPYWEVNQTIKSTFEFVKIVKNKKSRLFGTSVSLPVDRPS